MDAFKQSKLYLKIISIRYDRRVPKIFKLIFGIIAPLQPWFDNYLIKRICAQTGTSNSISICWEMLLMLYSSVTRRRLKDAVGYGKCK